MLTTADLRPLRGATITDAETREEGGRTILRFQLGGGSVLALEAREDVLSVSDESSIPWGKGAWFSGPLQ